MAKALQPLAPVAPRPLARPKRVASDAKLHAAAKQFDAMFMTEMLHHARPAAHAAGVFAPGAAERSWQVFMDQALGQAAAASGGSGLVREIETSLRAAQRRGSHNSVEPRTHPHDTPNGPSDGPPSITQPVGPTSGGHS